MLSCGGIHPYNYEVVYWNYFTDLMRHWRNVLAACRTNVSGLVQLLSFVNQHVNQVEDLWNLRVHWIPDRIEPSSLAVD
jgi:hypothetical protein